MNAPVPLGPADIALIGELQRNARASVQDLAEASGMSTSTCWRRLREFEARGVVRGYRAVLDAEALGLGFEALVQLSLSRQEPDQIAGFVRAVMRRDEVIDCFAATGESDYHLRVCCADKDAYYRFLEDVLFRIPGVSRVTSNLVLRTIKKDGALPLR